MCQSRKYFRMNTPKLLGTGERPDGTLYWFALGYAALAVILVASVYCGDGSMLRMPTAPTSPKAAVPAGLPAIIPHDILIKSFGRCVTRGITGEWTIVYPCL